MSGDISLFEKCTVGIAKLCLPIRKSGFAAETAVLDDPSIGL